MNDLDATQRQLDELLALPEGDPRREQALGDPAVRALYDSYRTFMAADATGVPGIDRADDALARLRGAMIMDGGADVRVPASARVDRRGGGAPWWQALFAPSLRPALAIAVLVVVAGAAWLALRPTTPEHVVVP